MEVGQSKMPNSAGQASVLIFPDLNTGNKPTKQFKEKQSISHWANVTRVEQTRK
jgi:phosphotransacetylase